MISFSCGKENCNSFNFDFSQQIEFPEAFGQLNDFGQSNKSDDVWNQYLKK